MLILTNINANANTITIRIYLGPRAPVKQFLIQGPKIVWGGGLVWGEGGGGVRIKAGATLTPFPYTIPIVIYRDCLKQGGSTLAGGD